MLLLRRLPIVLLFAGAVSVAGVAGCASWSYNEPPTVTGKLGPDARDESGRRVVVLGEFRNPPVASVAWPDIGTGMGDALARTILNHGDFDVIIDPDLARKAEAIVQLAQERRGAALARLRDEHPRARFVITGQVTDFAHTSEVPRDVRRRSWFGTKREAFVAIQMNVIDLELGRAVATDHVYGAAGTPRTKPKKLYEDMAFGTYLFWNSPLGRASEGALERAIAVLNRVVPTIDDSIRIVRQTAERRVQLSAASDERLEKGREFLVYVVDEKTGDLLPVHDPDTGQALRARIDEASRIAATAWLLGRKPESLDLRGAVLLDGAPPFGRLSDAGLATTP